MGPVARWLRKKWVIHLLLALPGGILIARLFSGTLGVEPLEVLFESLGRCAIYLLIATLSLSPLRILFPQWQIVRALNRHRRAFGVSTFWYAGAHFMGATLYEGGPGKILDQLDKPFFQAGLAALTLLFILSVTSLNWFVRKLGPKSWKNLHRLAYVVAVLAFYHFGMSGKDHWKTAIYTFSPLAALQVARVIKIQLPGHILKNGLQR